MKKGFRKLNMDNHKTKLPHFYCLGAHKLLLCLALCIGMFLFFPLSAEAKETTVHSVDIVVSLNQDGSANITENWDVTVSGITEWYLVQGSLGKIEIQNFSVSDETGRVYEYEGAWDIDRSLEEKAGKCGIVDKGDGSYELCWGVGSDGRHLFSASYHMTNFVKGFDDYCAFNQRLINDELSSPPQHISVTVTKPGTEFTPEDVGVWGFGFEGTIYVENGAVFANSDGALDNSDYVTVMCRFPRQMFDTANVVSGPFSDMQEQALKGSDYETASPLSRVFLMLGFLASIIIISILVVYAVKEYKVNRSVTTFEEVLREEMPSTGLTGNAYPIPLIQAQLRSHQDYCRDIPLECQIPAIYYSCVQTGLAVAQNDVIGAYLLKWLQSGNIEIREEKKEKGLGILNRQTPSIVLKRAPKEEDPAGSRLYLILEQASGGNHILQEKEMYHWAAGNYGSISEMLESINEMGKEFLKKSGYLGTIPALGLLNLYRIQKPVFTEAGREQMLRLKGLKNFLKDFTILNEREPQDVTLWDQYLIAAQLFGIADKVAEKFKAIYPAYFTDYASYYNNYAGSYAVIASISRAGINGASAGSGAGATSFGGGGGSSGGGSGGGGR